MWPDVAKETLDCQDIGLNRKISTLISRTTSYAFSKNAVNKVIFRDQRIRNFRLILTPKLASLRAFESFLCSRTFWKCSKIQKWLKTCQEASFDRLYDLRKKCQKKSGFFYFQAPYSATGSDCTCYNFNLQISKALLAKF